MVLLPPVSGLCPRAELLLLGAVVTCLPNHSWPHGHRNMLRRRGRHRSVRISMRRHMMVRGGVRGGMEGRTISGPRDKHPPSPMMLKQVRRNSHSPDVDCGQPARRVELRPAAMGYAWRTL